MSLTPVILWGPQTLGTSAAVLGAVVPANGKQVIKQAVFTNFTGVPQTIDVYVSRNGASLSNANVVITQFTISGSSTYVAKELINLVLGAGDAIYAKASNATAVNALGSGYSQ